MAAPTAARTMPTVSATRDFQSWSSTRQPTARLGAQGVGIGRLVPRAGGRHPDVGLVAQREEDRAAALLHARVGDGQEGEVRSHEEHDEGEDERDAGGERTRDRLVPVRPPDEPSTV